MISNQTYRAKLMMILSMAIWGTIGIFRNYISLPSSYLALTRGIIGMVVLAFYMLILGKRLDWKAIKKNMLFLCLSGIGLGTNWMLLFEAYIYCDSVATATLCYYMAPIIMIVAAPFILKEKMTVKKGLCAAAALIGMILVSGVLEETRGGSANFKGILFGIAAAFIYAAVVFLNKRIQGIYALDKTIIQLAVSSIIMLPYSLITENLAGIRMDITEILLILTVGIVHTGLAYALYFGSIHRLSSQTIALYSYIDPVLALVLSSLIIPNQGMTKMGIRGAVMILGATMICELTEKKK